MARRKALGNVAYILIALVALAGVGLFATQFTGQTASTVQQPTEYDGGFAAFQPVQELTGYNDLSVTMEELNSSNTVVDDSNVVTKYNINASNGQTLRFAYGIDVSGPMQSVDVQLTPKADTASALDITGARLVRDSNDDNTLADAPTVATFTADSDEEIDATVNGLQEGDYAFVLETRGTATGTIETDQDLYTITMDAQTDAGSDEAEEMEVTIDNAQ